jgi:hypothetical protein
VSVIARMLYSNDYIRVDTILNYHKDDVLSNENIRYSAPIFAGKWVYDNPYFIFRHYDAECAYPYNDLSDDRNDETFHKT